MVKLVGDSTRGVLLSSVVEVETSRSRVSAFELLLLLLLLVSAVSTTRTNNPPSSTSFLEEESSDEGEAVENKSRTLAFEIVSGEYELIRSDVLP